ncbi:MAG: hypothetical protein OHK0031_09490 [Anaerolineales bacterium]
MPKIFSLLLIVLLAACAPAAAEPSTPTAAAEKSTPTPAALISTPALETPLATVEPIRYDPLPSDKDLMRGEVSLESVEILTLESNPPQYVLALRGSLPTPCHLLRIRAAAPDAENKIIVEVYALTHPKMMCVQMLKAFEAQFPLGSFSAGRYSVWVNGQSAGEIEP